MASTEPPPAVRRTRYRTLDAEEGIASLRGWYTQFEPTSAFAAGGLAELRLDSDALHTPAGNLSLDRMRHRMSASVLAEPVSDVLVAVPRAGQLLYRCGHAEAAAVRVAPSWAPFVGEWDDLDVTVGTLDRAGVQQVGAEFSGLDPAAVRFTDMNPLSPALARHLVAELAHLQRDLLAVEDADAVLASPIVRGQAFRTLATAALACFPNSALAAQLDPATRGPGATEPAVVRRAVEFIDTHAEQPIGVTEIAEAARIGVRGLQSAFARHRDQSPLAYLRQVRMAGAHRDLQAGDATRGDTVAAIAARWGFAHAGRFSVDYRRAYGCSPRQTLRH